MADARTNILARLRQGRRESLPHRDYASDTKINAPLARFILGLEKVSATHETVTTEEQITEAVERYLQQVNADNELMVAPAVMDSLLLTESSLLLRAAPTSGHEESAVTLAYAGIAETGSLVMLSSADTPVTANFLADNFICVLKTQDVLTDMEALWARIAGEKRLMPRSINLITGPSRTADVEQIIQTGAHGPRRVHVILWNLSG